jgi:ribosomal protein S18 acetylase RimI-like enzyme
MPGYKPRKVEATMPVTIRRATWTDLPVIVDFNVLLARESEGKELDPAVVTDGVKAAMADPTKGPYYLAVDGDTVLGQTQITFEWSDWRNGWAWWIQGVYVRPEARRRGVFSALYDHIEREARRAGNVIALRLYVDQDNPSARETYRQLGMGPTNYLLLERFPL